MRHLFLTAAAVVLLGIGTAAAQQGMDEAQTCDAAAAAYKAYALNSNDPDLATANHKVTEGMTDCQNHEFTGGIRKINDAMALIHDHKKSR